MYYKTKSVVFKIVVFIIPMIMLVSTFSGCYDYKEVDDQAYVVAIGIDKGIKNNIKMTLMFAVPIAVGVGSESGESDKSSTVTTIEVPSIYGGINMVNTYLSKEINFSHAKLLVISSEIAKTGIDEILYSFIKNRAFRPTMFVSISRGSAENYLNNVKPVLETNPAKYFEMMHSAYEYTGFTTDSRLEDLHLQLECTCQKPVVALVEVNKLKSSEEFDSITDSKENKDRELIVEGDYKAGNMPFVSKTNAQIMGIAVFDGDKMVGELNGQETLYYLMLTGKYNSSNMTFSDPQIDNKNLSLSLKEQLKPKVKVEMENDIPKISTEVFLEGDILSIQSGINYEDSQKVKILEDYVGQFLEDEMLRVLEKTTDMKSDICGFGKKIKSSFFTWDEWVKFNWLNKYQNSTFDIKVKVKIRRTGLTIKQAPIFDSKGSD